MSLTHAILGMLQREPMTGYDLKTECFDTSISYFWPADQAQIYRTLDRMSDEGWVESIIEPQEGRPNRKVYSITEAGRQELARWLRSHQPLAADREPFLVQTFFAGQLSNAEIIGLMQQQIVQHQRLLREYDTLDVPLLDQLMTERHEALGRLTLEFGYRYHQMVIDWLNLAIETVRNLPEQNDDIT